MGRKDDLRFNDVRRRCQWRTIDGDCTHNDNELSAEPEPPCACDYCPVVETDIHYGDEAEYSEGEQPVRIIDRSNRRSVPTDKGVTVQERASCIKLEPKP